MRDLIPTSSSSRAALGGKRRGTKDEAAARAPDSGRPGDPLGVGEAPDRRAGRALGAARQRGQLPLEVNHALISRAAFFDSLRVYKFVEL